MSLRGTASASARVFMVTRLKMGAWAMRKKGLIFALSQQGQVGWDCVKFMVKA
jgi:hypothetical protein